MPIDFAKIKALREARQLTQEEAGTRAGFKKDPRLRWVQFESGRGAAPRMTLIEAACLALDCGIDELLTDDSPARPRRRGRATQ